MSREQVTEATQSVTKPQYGLYSRGGALEPRGGVWRAENKVYQEKLKKIMICSFEKKSFEVVISMDLACPIVCRDLRELKT